MAAKAVEKFSPVVVAAYSTKSLDINDAFGCVQIVLILQHHLVNLEDGGVVLTYLIERFIIEASQLLLGLGTGHLNAFPFLCRGQRGGLAGLCFRFL